MSQPVSAVSLPDYSLKLAREMKIAGGPTVTTLGEAATVLAKQFSDVLAWSVLGHATELLMIAAETGKRSDIAAATDALEHVFGGCWD